MAKFGIWGTRWWRGAKLSPPNLPFPSLPAERGQVDGGQKSNILENSGQNLYDLKTVSENLSR